MMVSDQSLLAPPLDLEQADQRAAVLRDLLGCLDMAAPTEAGAAARPLRLELDDPAVQAYAWAWCDLLTLLGALHWQGDMFTLVSPQAGYLVRMLRALGDAGAPLVADWRAEGVGDTRDVFGSGVNLLAALEQRRLALLPDAAPLRETHAALGLIVRRRAEAREALLVWDAPAGAWQLPGGRYEHGDGSLRATLLRELAEELGCAPLAEGQQLRLAGLGGPCEHTRRSPTYGLRTRTIFQLFAVRWLVELPRLGAGLRWLSEGELLAGRTADGQPIAAEPLLHVYAQLGSALEQALAL